MKVGVTTVSFSSNQILLDKLRETGFVIKVNPFGRRLSPEELIDFLKDCDSAIIGLDKITSAVLEECPRLRLISKYGVGLDNIDFDACDRFNVSVKYPIGVNKRSVSEMALSMILGLARNINSTSLELKEGIWNKSGGFEISGKIIGIIGFGNIGSDLAKLLKPFGVKILANDINPRVFEGISEYVYPSSKDEIFELCDVISVHTPLTEQTKNLINQSNLHRLKDGVILINTARGGIFNEKDVLQALKASKIGGLGIDVYVQEPPVLNDLISLKNVICTPHIGGNSIEAVRAMGIAAINNLL
jgi:phosphoglycerate dehydrogenase-like enzyme